MLKKSTSEEALIANAMPILKVFKNSLHKPLRLVDIEKKVRLSHQAVFRKAGILESGGMLVRTEKYYRLNFENILVQKVLELIAASEREYFLKKYPILREPLDQLTGFALKNRIVYIILFGSYAIGKAAKTSDIDLFIVIGEADFDAVKKSMDNLFGQMEGGYFLNKYGFSPVYATRKDVKEMVNERKKFIQSIIEEGIMIYGEENYFREMPQILKDWFAWK